MVCYFLKKKFTRKSSMICFRNSLKKRCMTEKDFQLSYYLLTWLCKSTLLVLNFYKTKQIYKRFQQFYSKIIPKHIFILENKMVMLKIK